MTHLAIFLVVYAITAYAAFCILMKDELLFKQSIAADMTNGDVVFCMLISALPLVGFGAALAVKFTSSHGPRINTWAGRPSRSFRSLSAPLKKVAAREGGGSIPGAGR